MSMAEAAVTKTLNQESDPKPQAKPKVTLKSILMNAKNHGSSWLHLVISTLTTIEERDCKSELDENKVWKPREATLLQSNKIYSNIMGEILEDMDVSSRTELDSHANMSVIGKNAYILSKIGWNC